MICDAKFRITNCVVKWPGSVHDNRIFRDSHISVAFEDDMLIQIYTCGKYVKKTTTQISKQPIMWIYEKERIWDNGTRHHQVTHVIHKKDIQSPPHDVYIIRKYNIHSIMIHLTIIVLSKILVGIKFHLFLENTYPWNSVPPPKVTSMMKHRHIHQKPECSSKHQK